MTKLTLTIEKDGAQVANVSAEITDFAKLKEVKEAIQQAFDDEEAQQP